MVFMPMYDLTRDLPCDGKRVEQRDAFGVKSSSSVIGHQIGNKAIIYVYSAASACSAAITPVSRSFNTLPIAIVFPSSRRVNRPNCG